MTPDEWFARLSDEIGRTVEITPDERRLLLDLARVAAHSSERWTAPLSTWIAGIVLSDVPSDQRVEHLSRIVEVLDEEPA